MGFQRARSDEQRTERRRHILATATAMLAEMPVAKLSLNELSRRVGLAKSNVLRYFESREAVLLQLMEAELQDWITSLESELVPTGGTPRERGDRLASVVAESLARRPVLCDLTSAHASVLEHNVSPDVALEHKRATHRALDAQAQLILTCVPELGLADASRLVGFTTLMVSAAWPYSRPGEAMLAAYAADPTIAMHVTFTDLVRQALEVAISGLLAREENIPLGRLT